MVVEALDGYDTGGLKTLASAITAQPGLAVALFSTTVPALAVVARSAGMALSAADVLRLLIAQFGGRGGGRPELAQGGGLTGSVNEMLSAAWTALHND